MAQSGEDAHRVRQRYYSCERKAESLRVVRLALEARQRYSRPNADAPGYEEFMAETGQRIEKIERAMRGLATTLTQLDAEHLDLVGESIGDSTYAHNMRQWYYAEERMTKFWKAERSALERRQEDLLANAITPRALGLTAAQIRERIAAVDQQLQKLDQVLTRLNMQHFDLVGNFIDVDRFSRSA